MNNIVDKDVPIDKHRILFIDIAKGFAILCVIIAHIYPKNSYVSRFVYTFMIPIFFICSGLTINPPYKKHNFSPIIKYNRVSLMLYLLFSIIYTVYDLLLHGLIMNNDTIFTLLKWDIMQVITFFGINVLWFLASMYLAKLVYELIIVFFEQKKLSHVIVSFISCLSIILGMAVDYYLGNNHRGMLAIVYFYSLGILRALGLMIFIDIGCYIKNFVFNFFLKNKQIKLSLFIGLTLLSVNLISVPFIGNIDWHFMKFENVVMMFLVSITGSVGILFISNAFEKRFRILTDFLLILGRNSLFVMIIHNYIIIDILSTFFSTSLWNNNYALRFIIVLIITVTITIFCGKYFNKMTTNIKKKVI